MMPLPERAADTIIFADHIAGDGNIDIGLVFFIRECPMTNTTSNAFVVS